MNDTDKLVAAIFAASMLKGGDAPRIADFLTHYDACLSALSEREDMAKKEVARKHMDTWKKLG